MLTERIVFNLAIDFGSASSFQTLVPDTLPVGNYWIGALADHNSVIAEHDEENNLLVSVGQLEIYVPPPPMPDLIVSSVSFTPDTIAASDVIQVSETIRNNGNLDASGVIRVGIYVSEDSEVTTDDTLLGTRIVSGLPFGQESGSTQDVVIPPGFVAGTYSVGVIVDDLEAVAEDDEENNSTVATQTLEVQ